MSSELSRLSIEDLDPDELAGRRALVRVDYNVPLIEEGEELVVASDARIRATLPTLRLLVERQAVPVLVSHLGRPQGQRLEELSLAPVAERLEELLGSPVTLLLEPFGPDGLAQVEGAQPGQLFLLENIRYQAGETANDPAFATELAKFGELFVQEAFGTVHRSHASTVGVTGSLEPCVAGKLVDQELKAFRKLLDDPRRPFVAILGGAKIAGKLETVAGLARHCDRVCLGGGMANTFLMAAGHDVGASLVEKDLVDEAGSLLDSHGDRIVLPRDAVVAPAIDQPDLAHLEPVDALDHTSMILDIGPQTVAEFEAIIGKAETIFWNGPLGVFEKPPFDAGTRAIADALAKVTAAGVYTVTGGGDSIAALESAGLSGSISHVSTGGGAALALVSGEALPGIDALDCKPEAVERKEVAS